MTSHLDPSELVQQCGRLVDDNIPSPLADLSRNVLGDPLVLLALSQPTVTINVMLDQKPTLEYSKPPSPWPWWMDLLFSVAAAVLLIAILWPLADTPLFHLLLQR